MPAPKVDFSTTRGRLQYARDQSQWDQQEFAQLIGIPYRTWQKVEQGVHQLKVEHLVAANQALKLDWRYFFGDISYEDARRGGEFKSYDDLVRELTLLRTKVDEKVRAVDSLDAVAERVMINRELRRLVETVQYWSGDMLRRVTDFATGLSAGVELSKGEAARASPGLGKAQPPDELPGQAAGGRAS